MEGRNLRKRDRQTKLDNWLLDWLLLKMNPQSPEIDKGGGGGDAMLDNQSWTTTYGSIMGMSNIHFIHSLAESNTNLDCREKYNFWGI